MGSIPKRHTHTKLKDLPCRFKARRCGFYVDTGSIDIANQRMNSALQDAVVTELVQSPVAIDASHSSFHLYKSGSRYFFFFFLSLGSLHDKYKSGYLVYNEPRLLRNPTSITVFSPSAMVRILHSGILAR